MAQHKTSRLVVALALLLVAGMAALFALLGGDGSRSERGAVEEPSSAALPQPVATRSTGAAETLLVAPEVEQQVRATEDSGTTTVVWPLEIQLELVRAAGLPEDAGLHPLGSGATAKLRGRVANHRGDGVAVTVEFMAGLNKGRVLVSDSGGSFGAIDLYPGLAIVEVHGPGILGSRREIWLRQRQERVLNIGYGMPASIRGRVFSAEDEPIEGAEVSIDGQVSWTNAEGIFALDRVASGAALVEITAPGYAAHREVLNVTVGHSLDVDRVSYTLHKGSTLELSVTGLGREQGPAHVVLLPANEQEQRTFPWYDLNPVEVWPGQSVRLVNLPAQHVYVRTFARGAVTERTLSQVRMREGRTSSLEVRMAQAESLSGVVMLNGEPALGAEVILEAPDRVDATARFLRKPTTYLERDIVPPLPPAVQRVTTDGTGRFELSAWESSAERRYLTATGKDGRTWAGRVVRKGERELDLALEPAVAGDSLLALVLPDRTQGIVFQTVVNGETRPPGFARADEDVLVDGLVDGEWNLVVRWHGAVLRREEGLQLRGDAEREVLLPRDAIEGQDEDTWQRAGRGDEWPGRPSGEL